MKFSNIFFFFFHRLSFVFHPAPIPIPADYIFPNSADVTLQIKLDKKEFISFPSIRRHPRRTFIIFHPRSIPLHAVSLTLFFSPLLDTTSATIHLFQSPHFSCLTGSHSFFTPTPFQFKSDIYFFSKLR